VYLGSSRQLSAFEDFALKDAAVVHRQVGRVGLQRRQLHLDPQVPWAFVVVAAADSWGSVAAAAVVATAVAVHLASAFAVVAVAGSSSWCSRPSRRWVHPP